jgi:hypothetical protein
MYAHATAVSKRRDKNLVSSLVEVLLLELLVRYYINKLLPFFVYV